MNRSTVIALAALATLTGGAAHAESFFIGFNSSPAPRYVYQQPVQVVPAPRYTYIVPQPVVYGTPAYYGPHYCPPRRGHHHHHNEWREHEGRGYPRW